MLYKELNNQIITIPARGECVVNAGEGLLLVPTNNDRIFLNWLNDKDKIISTHTLRYSTIVRNRVKLINPQTHETKIQQIELPALDK